MDGIRRVALVALLGASAAPLVLGQTAGLNARAGRPDGVRQLNALAAHRVTLPPEALRQTLTQALQSSDPSMTLAGIWALASRAAGFRFAPSDTRKALWWQEQPVVQELRPMVEARLFDPDASIRRGALIALGSLDYHLDLHPVIVLRPATAMAFARSFQEDRSPAVRAEAVKSFALAHSDPEPRDHVLLAALADPDPGVVQFAARGVAEHRLEAGVPAVAALIEHPSVAVRSAALQALMANRQAARDFLPQVQLARRSESDPTIRAILDATARVLERP